MCGEVAGDEPNHDGPISPVEGMHRAARQQIADLKMLADSAAGTCAGATWNCQRQNRPNRLAALATSTRLCRLLVKRNHVLFPMQIVFAGLSQNGRCLRQSSHVSRGDACLNLFLALQCQSVRCTHDCHQAIQKYKQFLALCITSKNTQGEASVHGQSFLHEQVSSFPLLLAHFAPRCRTRSLLSVNRQHPAVCGIARQHRIHVTSPSNNDYDIYAG